MDWRTRKPNLNFDVQSRRIAQRRLTEVQGHIIFRYSFLLQEMYGITGDMTKEQGEKFITDECDRGDICQK